MCAKHENIHIFHSQKKQKDILETRVVLLMFSLELDISGVAVQSIHHNSEHHNIIMATFVRNCLVKMTFKLF